MSRPINEEVSCFLKRFHEHDTIDETFTNGCCFWFAAMLVFRFKGRLMYDPVDGHFATEIDGRLYDITGDVTDKYDVIAWENINDEPYKNRIIRDCVMF